MASGRTFSLKTSRISLPGLPTPNESFGVFYAEKMQSARINVHLYLWSMINSSYFLIEWVENSPSMQQRLKAATTRTKRTSTTMQHRQAQEQQATHASSYLQTRSLAGEVETFISYEALRSGREGRLPVKVFAHWCASRTVNSHLYLPV